MTTAEHVKIVNDVSLSQRPTLPAARDKARASSASRDLFLVLCEYPIPRCFKPRFLVLCAHIVFYKSAPPIRGAVVRGARQHAPRRLMGGASSAFLAARGARGGSSCCCCSACAECSGLGCRTASAALRVAGGAGCVTTTRRLTISKTLQQTCVLGHYVV